MSELVQDVKIGLLRLEGTLRTDEDAQALIVFAHGSGSSRLSPRNNYVATGLRAAGLGTLMFDLLTEEEGASRAHVFDIRLLAERLIEATNWIREQNDLSSLNIGYFGASTGAAAALCAAAELGQEIGAVVSRGGRPDLANSFLMDVKAPTLLIVGGNDHGVIEVNKSAFTKLRCEKNIEIVPGATHLFEEPGALDSVISLARRWFVRHLITATDAQGTP